MPGSRRRAARLQSLRIFPEIRSAHMTDLNDQAPRPTLFFSVYYEAADRPLPQDWSHVSVLGAAWRIWRSRPQSLELYEPTWGLGVWILLALVYRLRMRTSEGQIVVYALANNPLENVAPGRLAPMRRASVPLRRAILGCVVGRLIDRLACGTPDAANFYAHVVQPRGTVTTIPALIAARDLNVEKIEISACFVGEIGGRKGVPQLLRAWETLEEQIPGATITLVGNGPLNQVVIDWCRQRPRARSFLGQLTREDVLDELARASVLILPSQPWPGWREQVGDPIVEGLSVGSTVVATTETGLAPWLVEHGHFVVEPAGSVDGLAAALEMALLNPIDPDMVRGPLPPDNGRIAADRWLHQAGR